MKLKDFLQDELSISPGSTKIPIKSIIDKNRERYDLLRKDTSKKFRHDVYVIMPGNRRVVHIKVPSETVPDFYYDVLLELDPATASTFEDCDIRIFSNCPSFVFNYAYVFYHLNLDTSSKKNRTGMIIDTFSKKVPRDRLLMPGSESKLGEEVLDNKPVVKNRLGLPFFDKSLYQAIFYLLDEVSFHNITSSKRYRSEAQVINSVSDFDTLMAKRKQIVDRIKLNERRKRETERRDSKLVVKSVGKQGSVRKISPVNRVKSASVNRIGKK